MTIANEQSRVEAQGNGATTSWSFSFLIPTTASAVVQVYDTTVDPATLSDVAQGSFTLAGAGVAAGGSVTYPLTGSPLASGQYLFISRVLAIEQTASIANAGNLYPQVIENALDYLTMVGQQLQTAVATLEDDVDEDVPPEIPPTTGVFSTLAATTASFTDFGATTASFGTLNISGLFIDSGFATASVTSGQTVTLSATHNFTALSLTASAATLTVHLPPAPVDGQSSGFSIDQTVTALTVSGNGHTLKNAPVTTSQMVGGSSFEWIYDATATAWYRSENSGVQSAELDYRAATASIDFGTVLTARSASGSVTVTGSVVGDFVDFSPTVTGLAVGTFYAGQVIAANTVQVFFCNLTGATVTTGTLSLNINVYPKAQFGL